MRGVRCYCIDDKNKPSVIPQDKWVKEGELYHITHIFLMKNQNNIQGCEIAEYDISDCEPYNCYRLSRFAILLEDIEKLVNMIKDCDDLNQLSEIDIRKYVEELETLEV